MQRVAPIVHAAGRKHLAVEADVGAVGELDVAVLARQDRVAADEHAAADPDAGFVVALGVEQAVVVDHDVVADVNLVRMTQHDVLAEHDVAAAAPSSSGYSVLRSASPSAPGTLCDSMTTSSYLSSAPSPGWPTISARTSRARRRLPGANRAGPATRGTRSRLTAIRAHGTTPASVRCPRAGRPAARSRARRARG